MTLSDILAALKSGMLGNGGAQSAGNALTDRDAYLAYSEACMMAGQSPLPYPQWVQAGKPKAPVPAPGGPQ